MIGETVSHYKILEKLGEGGMGVVYKAEDTKLKRTVALKFLPSKALGTEEEEKRFLNEAQAAAALNHPNIATIHEIDEFEGDTYIVMEYVEGENLKEKINSGPIKIDKAIDIAIQVAEGLQHAHKKEIVHRDIKSDNIMLTEDGQVKIMDFGLAKKTGATMVTKEGTTLGTAAYMSPEQARGETVDFRTDIWSLGVVLYEMLTGQMPFKGEYEQAVIYSILNVEPEHITDTVGELGSIIFKTLAKSPEERYRNAENVINDLRKLKKEFEFQISKDKDADEKHKPSIAVLPFTNMSADPEQEYFCDGMAEEILNALAHVEGLFVVARTSAFAFKGKQEDIREIGKKLNVNTVLEGSVRKAGNKLRITAQLINVSDGYHIWSERYDQDLEDIFAVQDEISLAIVDNLKVKLLKEEESRLLKRYTEDQEAYYLFLKGIYFKNKLTKSGLDKAIEYFQKAVEKDPDFALAYLETAGIYGAFAALSIFPPKDMWIKARDEFNKALEIDNTLAECHSVSANLAFWFDWDWNTAEERFKKAISLNPHGADTHAMYAWHQMAMGKFENAIKEITLAQEIDPLLPAYRAFGVCLYHFSGKPEEAIEQFHKAVEIDPGFALAYFHAGKLYFYEEMFDEAVSSFQKAVELGIAGGWVECNLGSIYIIQGDRNKAEKILKDLLDQTKKQYVSGYCVAYLYNSLGETDKTFEWLQRAYQDRDILMPYIKAFHEFDNLHSDPRFTELLKKMRLI
jgi:serine/threonine protein kinase/Tfp pilus assembly protein PilF